jgi:hypothetical protein
MGCPTHGMQGWLFMEHCMPWHGTACHCIRVHWRHAGLQPAHTITPIVGRSEGAAHVTHAIGSGQVLLQSGASALQRHCQSEYPNPG